MRRFVPTTLSRVLGCLVSLLVFVAALTWDGPLWLRVGVLLVPTWLGLQWTAAITFTESRFCRRGLRTRCVDLDDLRAVQEFRTWWPVPFPSWLHVSDNQGGSVGFTPRWWTDTDDIVAILRRKVVEHSIDVDEPTRRRLRLRRGAVPGN